MGAIDELVSICGKQEEDANVKSLALWAIGRIGPEGLVKSKKVLIKELTNSYWKVRTTACMAISSMGPGIAPSALPTLRKILKDGSVNRQTVAETIISLGSLGIQEIIYLLKEDS